ncbi:hypothetical protein FM103_07270 [Corynebacterium xerosis]|nr:hypothetical protein FM103_07270 [Corynebacterium xerosis]
MSCRGASLPIPRKRLVSGTFPGNLALVAAPGCLALVTAPGGLALVAAPGVSGARDCPPSVWRSRPLRLFAIPSKRVLSGTFRGNRCV